MINLAYIAAGGAIGSVLRYLMQGWVQRVAGPWITNLMGAWFPLGTLAVNLSGCLVIGLLTALLAGPVPLREEHRLGLTVGVLGGFTTFSTFGLETYNLSVEGHYALAMLYVAASCSLGLAGVWLGHRVVSVFV